MSISQTELGSVPHKCSVAVVIDTEDDRLIKEANQLKIKLIGHGGEPDYIVYFGKRGVEIRKASTPKNNGHIVDFSTIDRRVGAGNLSHKQPLPKALGATSKTVIDATAGFGGDASMMTLMGYTVIAIERSPILSVLLRDGLQRALLNNELREALCKKLTIVEADATTALHNQPPADVVFLDPMFPPKRKKSALPQGSIQALQAIVGYDDEKKTNKLFQIALQTALRRVVVKRPNYAPLFGDNPVAIHKGKLVRYEVYKPK
jgi:16S rRNA (guanine1516-N2)-methyltransferase